MSFASLVVVGTKQQTNAKSDFVLHLQIYLYIKKVQIKVPKPLSCVRVGWYSE